MNIRLAPVEDQHLSWLRNQRNRKEIMDFCRQPFLLNNINQDDWLKECSRRHTMIPFMVLEGDTWVGYAAFSNMDWVARRAECSYFIAPEFMNRGYGEEAIFLLLEYGFRRLNFQKIHSDTFEYNVREIEINKKMGFKEYGMLPRHYFKRGRLVDSLILCIFKEDFDELYKDRIGVVKFQESNLASKPL